MDVIALQSGSNGNCVVVEAGGVRLVIDAGISGKQAALRLAARGRDIGEADALLLSHDHGDHARSAGVFHRKFGLPIHATEATLDAADARHGLGRLSDTRPFRAGEALRFGEVTVQTLPTPHDGVDGVAFIVDDGRTRLGILTDLGHVFDGLAATLATLDAVLIESNYDEEMLEYGPYPAALKSRIRGDGGHLSNVEAAELLAAAGGSLRWACLGHLSGDNNTPAAALRTHRRILGDRTLGLAGRHEATAVMAVT